MRKLTKTVLRTSYLASALFLISCGGNTETTMQKSNLAPAAPQISNPIKIDGRRADYAITLKDGVIELQRQSGAGSIIVLPATSAIQFSDFRVNLLIAKTANGVQTAQLESIIELYIAFLNRLPDADGLAYWIAQVKAGMTLEQLADSFYHASVFYSSLTGYSSTTSDADFVKIIYKNVLGRTGNLAPPDADVNYWAEQLRTGQSSRGKLLNTMLNSARTFTGDPKWGWVPLLLENKVKVGMHFAVEQGLNYISPEESIVKTMAIVSKITPQDIKLAMASYDTLDPNFSLTDPSNRPTPPLSVAGYPQTVLIGSLVTLDGNDSYSPSGKSLNFTWQFDSKPVASVAKLNDTKSSTPSFIPDVVGTYTIQLVVSDKTGGTASSLVSIHAEAENSISYRGQRNYTTWSNYTDTFHLWEGKKTILRSKKTLSSLDTQTIVNNLDYCFSLYQRYGQINWPTIWESEFPNKGQLSIVPDNTTCGAGCGAGGRAEMTVTTFESSRGNRRDIDPYAWWVGVYEYGRQGGRAFPIYQKLDHFKGDSTEPGGRLTSAFPEFIWQICLGDLGMSQELIQQRGQFSSVKYRTGFLASGQSYIQAIEPEFNDRIIPGSSPEVWPSQLESAVLYYLRKNFGEPFIDTFFKKSMNTNNPKNAQESACNIMAIARAADYSKRDEIKNYLVTQWRFPDNCADLPNSAPEAFAGSPQYVLTGAKVLLDGSRSSDANSDQLSYQWSITSRPTDSTAILDDPNSMKPSFSADKAGSYQISLSVNDGRSTSNASIVTVIASVTNPVIYRGQRSYTTWGSSSGTYTGSFHVWEGKKIILRSQQQFDSSEIQTIVSNLDQCFGLYQQYGQTTWPLITDNEFGAKGQLSLVPENTTCGAGCGAGGRAEVTLSAFGAARGNQPNIDAYGWWLGIYEFGRQGGRAFPIFQKLDHFHAGTNIPGERLTSAFPEFIWHRCLRDLGYSQEQLLRRGPYASKKYREGYLASNQSYLQAIAPAIEDRIIEGSQPSTYPRNMITSLLFYLNETFGDAFIDSFFKRVMTKPDATNPRISACNIMSSAKEALPQRSKEVQDYLVREWRLPDDCP